MSYKLIFDETTGKPRAINRLRDNACIPLDEGNSDFQRFLEWNAVQPASLDLVAVDQSLVDAAAAQETLMALRAQAIKENLPTWQQVSDSVDNISNLADAKVFLKKLSRVVYWLAKHSAE